MLCFQEVTKFSFEILSSSPFHQHLLEPFSIWVPKCFPKLFFNYSLALWFFGAKILAARKMLKKLIEGLGQNLARSLMEAPSNVMTPRQFAKVWTSSEFQIHEQCQTNLFYGAIQIIRDIFWHLSDLPSPEHLSYCFKETTK